MEQKINIAELLKDCPKGMELECTMYDDIRFDSINDSELFPITIRRPDTCKMSLTKYGQYSDANFAKCIIFPKGKTTWEGFIPPCKFKDGDIVTCTNRIGSYVAIFKEKASDTLFKSYVVTSLCKHPLFKINSDASDYSNPRFATVEEKEKLFDVIKANGYEWNAESKTLKELVEPRFKAGNRIRNIKNNQEFVVISISANNQFYNLGPHSFTIWVKEQDNYELVPNKFDINTLKPYDRVLVRNIINEKWNIHFFSCIDSAKMFKTMMGTYIQCIPYEGNEHLLDKTDDCEEYYKTWKD